MNPSLGHSTDAYSQRSQFRPLYQPTTSQSQLVSPGTPVYSDLTTLTSTRPNHARPHTAAPSFKALRPQYPSELGERAEKSLGDAARPLKTWLRVAEEAKRHANRFQEQGDFESAFFEFCRVALILLEKIPSHPDYKVLLTPTQRHNVGMHGQDILDSLAELKPSVLGRWEQWREDPSSGQIHSAPVPISHFPPQQLVAPSSIQSHSADIPPPSTPTIGRASNSQVSSMANRFHTGSRRDSELLEKYFKLLEVPSQKQAVTAVPPLAYVRSSQSHEPPSVANVPSTSAGASEALEVITEVLNEDELEADSLIYSPSFMSSDTTSIASYKTERSINSRKSHYNALPRRKYAGIEQPTLPTGLGLVSAAVDEAEASGPRIQLSGELLSNLLGSMPCALKTSFAEEKGPNADAQLLDRPLKIHGSSSYGLSIVKAASQLELMINQWASRVLRLSSSPVEMLQEGVLKVITRVGDRTALFSDLRSMTVQYLLRHALSQVISECIVNSLIVTDSAEENAGFTRVHESLLSFNVPGAAVWRRHTFSVAVQSVRSELLEQIFDRKMPFLAGLLPGNTADLLGTRDVLEDAFKFSCMLRGTNTEGDALYRSYVPKLGSTLHMGLVELVKPCRCIQRGEVDRVGATVFPGLFELLPVLFAAQSVVRRAQVICECELATTDVKLAPYILPIPLPAT